MDEQPKPNVAIESLRFLNLLDDVQDVLSPTKFNIWAANIGAVATCVATIFAWINHALVGIETVWTGSVAWLSHAHISHQANKRENNRVSIQKNKQNED